MTIAGDRTSEVDVLIVGAGVSGIGAAARLVRERPGARLAILESREQLGGTWDLHRYPGIRSDTDVTSITFPFEPWTRQTSIVTGQEIWDYLAAAVRTYRIEDRIHYSTRVTAADWDSAASRWLVSTATGQVWRAQWLYLGTGYYDFERPNQPTWPGTEEFTAGGGRVVHPQLWPEDLSYAGQRVVVIGSGATAVTMAPALVRGPGAAAHVTMLQRTPSYVVAQPVVDHLANAIRRVLPGERGHRVVRAKAKATQVAAFEGSRYAPALMRQAFRLAAAAALRSVRAADAAFDPPYAPWAQRLTVAADGDIFTEMRRGRVDVVTDTIERFVAGGIQCASGRSIPADLVVSATGMTLRLLGGIPVRVDGAKVEPGERACYLGVMLDGVPNLGYAMGSLSAAWTLRADEATRAFLRLIDVAAERGAQVATPAYSGTPVTAESTPSMQLASGYVQRALDIIPKQGDHWPWTVDRGLAADVRALRRASMTKDMRFTAALVSRP